jgi:hypothetical protein
MSNFTTVERARRLSRCLRIVTLIAATGVAACAPAPLTKPAPPTEPTPRTEDASAEKSTPAGSSQQLTDAMNLAAAHDWPKAQAAFRGLIEAKSFRALSSHDQFQALWFGSVVAIYHGDKQLGYRYLLRAVAMPEAGFEQWSTLLGTAAELRDKTNTARSLTTLARQWPDQAAKIDADFISQVVSEARQSPHAVSLPLLQALYGAHWKLRWDIEPSAAWRDLTLLLLEKNLTAEAIDVSSHVTDPYVLIVMRADRRFDAVVAANAERFDINAAAVRELHEFETASEASPRSLELRVRILAALEQQQHYGAMLAASDSVLLEIRSTNYPEKSYEDYNEQYSKFLEFRAVALEMLGRWDEGVEELLAGSRLRENRQANVSQVIELANLYCELGRPAEAIPILDKAGANISGYGAMQKESVRLWAALQLGDNKQSALSLKFLSEHRSDAPGTYFDALIIANKPAEAERFMLARLRDTDLRQEALGEVQMYALPPLPPLAMAFETARRSVIDRDSVQAQIRKVGRVETYHLESP